MNKRALILLAVVLAASGCAHSDLSKSSSSGSGLVVEQFKVSDDKISSGQQGRITLRLKNFHSEDLTINEISLFNTGVLEVEDKTCSPSMEQFGSRRDDIVPQMECNWIVKAEDLGEFSSKNIPLKLNLVYDTSMDMKEPMKVHFRPLNQIENTKTIEKSHSNGELKIDLSTSNPIAFEQNGTLKVNVNNVGNGRIKEEKYMFEYSPSSLFECPEEKEFAVGSKVQFSCDISEDSDTGSQVTRNLFVTTSYKYVKQPSLDIRVVN